MFFIVFFFCFLLLCHVLISAISVPQHVHVGNLLCVSLPPLPPAPGHTLAAQSYASTTLPSYSSKRVLCCEWPCAHSPCHYCLPEPLHSLQPPLCKSVSLSSANEKQPDHFRQAAARIVRPPSPLSTAPYQMPSNHDASAHHVAHGRQISEALL